MPNELKPEDVIRDFETAMRNGKYFGYIYPKVTYGQLEAAITILREKDAEIKKLTSRVEVLHEIELSYALQYGNAIDKDIARKQLRAEAITEFEKKLMEKKCHYTETEHTFDFDGVTVEDIEQTAEKLIGGSK